MPSCHQKYFLGHVTCIVTHMMTCYCGEASHATTCCTPCFNSLAVPPHPAASWLQSATCSACIMLQQGSCRPALCPVPLASQTDVQPCAQTLMCRCWRSKSVRPCSHCFAGRRVHAHNGCQRSAYLLCEVSLCKVSLCTKLMVDTKMRFFRKHHLARLLCTLP